MIPERKVRQRFHGAIERLALSLDRERVAKYAADRLAPVAVTIIKEELRALKREISKKLEKC